jgi:hypothetical protein
MVSRHRRGQYRADRIGAADGQQARKVDAAQAGPRRIVHEHPLVLAHRGRQRLQCRQHRVGTLRAADAGVHRLVLQVAPAAPVRVLGMQRDHHAVDVRMPEQRAQAVLDHGPAGNAQVLLRHLAAKARAATCSGDDGPGHGGVAPASSVSLAASAGRTVASLAGAGNSAAAGLATVDAACGSTTR